MQHKMNKLARALQMVLAAATIVGTSIAIVKKVKSFKEENGDNSSLMNKPAPSL